MSCETVEEKFETVRNKIVDEYFLARPQIFRTREKECYIEYGFHKAIEVMQSHQKEDISLQ